MIKMVTDQNKNNLLKIEDILKKQQSKLEVYKKLSDRTGLKCFPVLPHLDASISSPSKLNAKSKVLEGRPLGVSSTSDTSASVPSRYAAREVLVDFGRSESIAFDLKQGNPSPCSGGESAGDESKLPSIHLIEECTTASAEREGPNFLPGDCLVEVNGRNVENLTTAQVWELMSRCKDEHHKVLLKVRPLPELNELSVRTGMDGSQVPIRDIAVKGGSLRRSGTLRMMKTKTEPDKEKEKDKEKDGPSKFEVVWIKHKEGFTSAIVVGRSSKDETKVKVRLDQGQVEMEVNESDVEEANPAAYDRMENLSSLRLVNESSCLHTLRHRYHSNLTHTFAGDALVVIRPMTKLCVYSEKVMSMFRGCNPEDAIPHIYATAQASYSSMISDRKDQAILLAGPSGGGKTTNLFHLLHYYTVIASPSSPLSSSSSTSSSRGKVKGVHLKAACTLMEAFGNCRTILNSNATRFVQVVKASFDGLGYLSGLTFQAIHLEKNRLSRRPQGEPTYHVFYQMLAGIDGELRRDLHLDRIHDPNVLMTPLQKPEDQEGARDTWKKITSSMECLGFSETDLRSVLFLLAAIFHVGSAGVIRGEEGGAFQFARPAAANKAADLLGCTPLDLTQAIFGGNQRADRKESDGCGLDLVGQFVGDLYLHLFKFVVSLINRHLSPADRNSPSVLVVDPPGLQDPQACGRQGGADLYDLECNYINERLERFCRVSLVESRLRLLKEELNETYPSVEDAKRTEKQTRLLRALDGSEHKMLCRNNFSNNDARNTRDDNNNNKKSSSVFQILNEIPTNSTNAEKQLDALHDVLDAGAKFSSAGAVTVDHLYDSTPVQYNVQEWIKSSRQVPDEERTRSFLLRSTRQEIRDTCFCENKDVIRMPSSSSPSSSSPFISPSSSRYEQSGKRQTRISGLIGSTNALLKELNRRDARFVFCWHPSLKSTSSKHPDPPDGDHSLDVQLVRKEWRGTCLLEAATLHRLSHPEHYTYGQFLARFNILRPHGLESDSCEADDADGGYGADRKMTELILRHQKVDPASYKFGKTRVFFRPGALSMLNVLCDDAIGDWILALQTAGRGVLARRKANRMRRETDAILCIQEAVRNYLELRRWKWWRLFDKVRRVAKICNNNNHEVNNVSGYLGSPFLNGSRFEDGTNTSDIITDSIIGDYSFANQTVDDIDVTRVNRSWSSPLRSRQHHQIIPSEVASELELRRMKMKHMEDVEELESAARSVERKLAYAIEDVSCQRMSLEGATKELKMKNEQLRHLNGLIEEKMKENEDLKILQKRTERDAAGKEGMLKFEQQQKEQLLDEIKQLEREKLITKQQLEDALYDLDRETGKRRDAEVRMNLYCGASDEYERLKKQNDDLIKEKKRQTQRLENQEATVKKLIETISKLEETNLQAKQAMNRMERRNEEEMDGQKTNSKKLQAMESRMNELLREKEDQIGVLSLNEARLKQVLRECDSKYKVKERRLRMRVRKLTELLKSDQSKNEKPNLIVKMLKAKMEDMDDEMESMKRLKRGVDEEVVMVQGQLDNVLSSKSELEEKNRHLLQENSELSSQIEDRDYEYNELMKKYNNLVQQNALELDRLREQSEELEELRESSKRRSAEVQSLESKLQRLEGSHVSGHVIARMEARIAEMKTSMEMESFAKKQAEAHLARLKDLLQKERGEKVHLQEVSEKKSEEITSLQGALKVQKSRVICLETRLQDLEGLIAQLRRKLDEQQDDCKGHSEEIGLLNRRIMAIQSNASLYWSNGDGDHDDDDDEDDIKKILARGKVILLSPRKSLLESSEA